MQNLQDQLKKQEKLSSLGLLTAGIVHEIRNPLNFVINFSKLSDTLLNDLNDDIEDNIDKIPEDDADDINDILCNLRENLAKIREHGERATSIIQNILQYSRGKEGERIPSDINALVHEYVWLGYHAMRANYSGFNATIKEHYVEDLSPIAVVPQDISRAILNIVNNAFYAIWERSKTEGEDYKPTIDICTSEEGEELSIIIGDNGNGMTDEVKAKIAMKGFDPQYGARQIIGNIRKDLRHPLSKLIIAGKVKGGDTIVVGIDGDELKFEVKQ